MSCKAIKPSTVIELNEEGTKGWAEAAAPAFDLLKTDECRDAPKPEWWNDEGLKALSARVVGVVPDSGDAYAMRARVLSGDALGKATPYDIGIDLHVVLDAEDALLLGSAATRAW